MIAANLYLLLQVLGADKLNMPEAGVQQLIFIWCQQGFDSLSSIKVKENI